MKDKIKIGIVGLGRAGFGMQCNELKEKQDKFETVAGCDTYEPWLLRMKKCYPNCSVYSNINDLLNNKEIELVSIATRSVDHFKHSLMVLDAGKNVLVDKPMCLTFDEAIKLKEASAKSKNKLYVRHNRRFDPDFLCVKKIVDSGILGYVHTIKLSRLGYARRSDWQTLRKNGGGQLLNWGPHLIDHALQLMNETANPIKDIWADCKQLISGGDCEDHVKIIVKGENGSVADIEISGSVAINVPEYIVWGTRGSLQLSLKDLKILVKYIEPEQKLADVKVDDGVPGRENAQVQQDRINWVEEQIEVSQDNLPNFWDELYESIRNNKPFIIKMREAIEVMRIISEVRKIGSKNEN